MEHPGAKISIKVVKEDLCLEVEFRAKAEDLAGSSRRHSLGGREPQGADVKPVERTGEGGGPRLPAERLASRVTWGRPSSVTWTRRAGARPLREPDPENMHNQELLESSHKVETASGRRGCFRGKRAYKCPQHPGDTKEHHFSVSHSGLAAMPTLSIF